MLDLKKIITGAIHRTVERLFLWTGSELKIVVPEYVLTTFIADDLSEAFNVFNGHKILLERKTRYLVKESLTHRFYSRLGQKRAKQPKRFVSGLEKIRNGRVDIVVIKESGFLDQVVTLVEIKGVNPSKNKVIEDIKRLNAFCDLKNEVGQSTLESAYFVALYQFDTIDKFESKEINKIYKKILNDNNICPSNLYIEIIKNKVEIDELENEYIGSVCIVSVIVEIHR
ncbi:MAG: hypothetical protein IBX50_15380 [Marinospirillum sp.]|uniref:hypothetical protein n=1 Tax=Marinospirillum sp. TaxID=2183934 RepID=UPI0019E88698|nr:hypothetical protein [Marinospirillum sp.]MBE0508070.1 hypothetical protein [Marinospirillum sp.]